MALPSTYHLSHSLPNRSPNQRPRSLSLSEYQPISFDRDALESAYQASLALPSSYTSSIITGHSSCFGGASTETHDTSVSSFPTQPKLDNFPTPPPPPIGVNEEGGYAGVGAGHTLTPPQSPMHKAAHQLNQASMRTSVPPSPKPPTPPPRPAEVPETTFKPALPPRRPQVPEVMMRRSQSDMGHDRETNWGGGYEWIEGDGHGRGKRRALPAIPTNVPVPEPPQWEPDYKPQIPTELTASSASYAYASLGAPPPNLPPRRVQPRHQQQQPANQLAEGPTMGYQPFPSASSSLTAGSSAAAAGPSRPGPLPSSSFQNGFSTSSVPIQLQQSRPAQMQMPNQDNVPIASPPAGAPDYPPTGQQLEAIAAAKVPKRDAEKEVFLRATDKTPIWSTHYLDPSLRQSLINVPHQVTNVANIALSGLSSGPKERYNSTIGAPIDGLARAAKDWAISPDGRFVSEHGGQELGVGIINSGGDGWGRDKGRKKARVEVVSKSGGIKVDVVEISPDRQLDMKIETKTGDVLVLLPDNFHGPIHITSPSKPPEFLSIVAPLLKPLANPYSSFYTTFFVPLAHSRDPQRSNSAEYNAMTNIERHVPSGFREESEMFNQVVGGYTSHTRGEHSKISIKSEKGRVVVGLRESRDEEDVKSMGLRVGVMDGGKKGKKRWWRP
ncbi:hypothetical protein I317_05360 [Kwoniella heveanensis CBS 569]|nr:hypothetical protein I317_05360 [Kwoniella heveanensis CBS 569]